MTIIPNQAVGLSGVDNRSTPWLCIAGAKGGVGKTMLACNLALLLARAGYRTLLVDFDPGTGNVGVQLRLQGRYDLDDIAAHRCSVAEATVEGPNRMHVVLGRSGPTDLAGAPPTRFADLLRTLRSAAQNYDVVVFDTGAGLNPSTLAVAEQADLTLGVTTPEVTALTDAYALCKVLHARDLKLPHLIINRTRSRDEAMRTAAKLNAVTDKFLSKKSELAGWIRRDDQVEASTRTQRPLGADGKGQAIEDLRSICAATLAALPPLRRGKSARRTEPRSVRLRPSMPRT